MRTICIQDLLGNVEKPSRYLGTEVNRCVKNPSDVKLHMALAFPDLYEIGTSHFGIQILYHLLNQNPQVAVERVYAPARDMAELLRQRQVPLCSLETQTPLNRFHVIGFSLLYELNYTNVLNMLDLAGIPFYARQRDENHPLIIAGGPCVSNPEPMAQFFDAMLFGDGEEALPQMAAEWIAWKDAGGGDRNRLLERWTEIQGVYIPSFFHADYDSRGFQTLTPKHTDQGTIRRAIVADLDRAFFPQRPIVPFGKPIHDRLRLEISRGCTRGCRFCQAGMLYRPVRERSSQNLLDLVDASLAATGYDELSLLSLSTGDYTRLVPLMEALMQRCQSDRVAVSLPSIRAGTLTPRLMSLIKKVRKTGFTIAPEAGSQRLRDVINKNILFEDVEETIANAFDLGWRVIKLYFMIGLPTETDEDIDAIVDMVQALKQIKGPRQRRGQINVSVTTFIPKAHTPFQWASQLSIDASRAKMERIAAKLRRPGLQIKWQDPRMSVLEGVLARGDRRMADVIEQAWRLGCTFDGWSDWFDFGRWQQAIDACELDFRFFTERERQLDEPLPWQHMDSGVTDAFLREQLHASFDGERLPDCRNGQCQQCGVCDFDTIRPRIYEEGPTIRATEAEVAGEAEKDRREPVEYEMVWTKMGPARFFGHLETIKIMSAALRRLDLALFYSKGFHPIPQISFDNPLPLGMESQAERMWVKTAVPYDEQALMERINSQLAEGIRLTGCRRIGGRKDKFKPDEDHYNVFIDPRSINPDLIERFVQSSQWPYERKTGKGRVRVIDLKDCVKRIEFRGTQTLYLAIKRMPPHLIRPAVVLQQVLSLTEEQTIGIRVVRLDMSSLHND